MSEFRPQIVAEKPDTGPVVDNSPEPNDAWLLAAIQRGDRYAAQTFYTRYVETVEKMVWRLLGPDAEHDDIVNEIFLRALTKCQQVKDAEKLRSWLLTVTVTLS